MLAYFPHLIQSSSRYSPALSGLQLCQASVQMFLLCGYRVQTLIVIFSLKFFGCVFSGQWCDARPHTLLLGVGGLLERAEMRKGGRDFHEKNFVDLKIRHTF